MRLEMECVHGGSSIHLEDEEDKSLGPLLHDPLSDSWEE